MKYDFTTLIDRKYQGSVKWQDMYAKNPDVGNGVVPLSVADMEFINAPEIREGLKKYIDSTILGYTFANESFYDALISWMKRRHNFHIEKEWVINSAGVVPAFFNAIKTFSKEGEGVIIMPPVYYPFFNAINLQKRKLLACPLINTKGYYTINFDLLDEIAAKKESKILLFCSPHNPVGRVWTKKELSRLAEIVIKHDLLLLSDEIHHDLIMPGYKHIVTQTLSEELAERTITMTAPSKTFNLAGMSLSNTLIKNQKLREEFKKGLDEACGTTYTALGYKSCEIAYNQCEEWLGECIAVINENRKLLHNFFKENFPSIVAPLIEGTYLQWVDFRSLGMNAEELEDFMINKAELFLDEGYIFGSEGKGFERFNLAVPTDVIKRSLERLKTALRGISR